MFDKSYNITLHFLQFTLKRSSDTMRDEKWEGGSHDLSSYSWWQFLHFLTHVLPPCCAFPPHLHCISCLSFHSPHLCFSTPLYLHLITLFIKLLIFRSSLFVQSLSSHLFIFSTSVLCLSLFHLLLPMLNLLLLPVSLCFPCLYWV